MAQACQARDARVAIRARTKRAAQARRIENGFAAGYACDVNDITQVRAMMADLSRRHGRLDLLVANMGALRESDFARWTAANAKPSPGRRASCRSYRGWRPGRWSALPRRAEIRSNMSKAAAA